MKLNGKRSGGRKFLQWLYQDECRPGEPKYNEARDPYVRCLDLTCKSRKGEFLAEVYWGSSHDGPLHLVRQCGGCRRKRGSHDGTVWHIVCGKQFPDYLLGVLFQDVFVVDASGFIYKAGPADGQTVVERIKQILTTRPVCLKGWGTSDVT